MHNTRSSSGPAKRKPKPTEKAKAAEAEREKKKQKADNPRKHNNKSATSSSKKSTSTTSFISAPKTKKKSSNAASKANTSITTQTSNSGDTPVGNTTALNAPIPDGNDVDERYGICYCIHMLFFEYDFIISLLSYQSNQDMIILLTIFHSTNVASSNKCPTPTHAVAGGNNTSTAPTAIAQDMSVSEVQQTSPSVNTNNNPAINETSGNNNNDTSSSPVLLCPVVGTPATPTAPPPAAVSAAASSKKVSGWKKVITDAEFARPREDGKSVGCEASCPVSA